MRVYEMMDSRVAMVSANDYAAEALRIMALQSLPWLFVLDCGEVAGIVCAQDLQRLSDSVLCDQDVREYVLTNVVAISPELEAQEAERLLRVSGREFLGVVKDGRPIGVFTAESVRNPAEKRRIKLQAS